MNGWRRRIENWSIHWRASIAAAGVVALALVLVAWAWPTIDAYARAVALFSDAVLHRQLQPDAFVTPAVTEELQWPGGGRGVLTRPDGTGPYPAFMLILGAEPADPGDPRVQRLTGGLARIGIATLLPRSEPLIDGAVTPDEISLLVGAFTAMRDHRALRSDRIGFVGLSTGGSEQVVAASDPAIADSVWFVLAMGGYHDAGTLAAEVLSRQYETPAGLVAWDPDETAVRVVRNTLLAALSAQEAKAVSEGAEPTTDDGRVVAELLRVHEGVGPPLERAHMLIREFTPGARARLTGISPSAHLGGLRAPLYLLHDRSDPFIPWTHSEAMAAQHPPRAYHLLDIFAHVEARPSSLGVLVRDGRKLLGVFSEIIREGRSR